MEERIEQRAEWEFIVLIIVKQTSPSSLVVKAGRLHSPWYKTAVYLGVIDSIE
jgi:hypothetical protein